MLKSEMIAAISTAPVFVFDISGFRFPNLNDLLRATKSHWGNYAKSKETYTGAVKMSAKPKWGSRPPIDFPVLVLFCWHVGSGSHDADNVAFGKKYVLDGLQAAGVLKNDGPKIVRAFIDFLDNKGEGVTVAIYRLP